MFNVSLGDRLKAAVNQLEATGTSLQARASAGLQAAQAAQGGAGQIPAQIQAQAQNAAQAGQIPLPTSPSVDIDAGRGIDAEGPRGSISRNNSTNRASTSASNAQDITNMQGQDAVVAGTTRGGVTSPRSPEHSISTSPNRSTYSASAAHLADSAISGLSGLRRSFNFRASQDGGRPTSSQLAGASASGSPNIPAGGVANGADRTGPQELKEMPTSPLASTSNPSNAGEANYTTPQAPSRTSSPARFLSTSSTFGIGSDPSTAVQTPKQPRSPAPGQIGGSGVGGGVGVTGLGLSKLRSPVSIATPLPPDPDDPASYPLPPSPGLEPALASSSLTAPLPRYADPLGASPLLAPGDEGEPTGLELQAEGIELSGAAEGTGVGEVSAASKARDAEADEEILAAERTVEALEDGEGTEGLPPLPAVQIEHSSGDIVTQTLRNQIDAANKLIRELTPLETGIEDTDALEGWVKMMKGKVDVMGEEMTRLRGQLALQDSRIEELRDTHRLEGTSQSGLIAKLRSQLSTAESNLAARVAELSSLNETKADLNRAQIQIKEEEEKRTKAIQLLKTVRLKLVKAEKDKEEVERDRAEERAERSRAQDDAERLRAEKEREVSALRRGFERELNGQKERWEREMKEKKGAWELEMITTKASHARELSNKTTMVAGLEEIVKELNKTKDEQFHTIQARQAEAETARADSEVLQNRTKELEFQLREAAERVALLEDSASSAGPSRNHADRGRANGFLDGSNGRFASSPSPSPTPSRRNSSSGLALGSGASSGQGLAGPSPAEVQRIVAEAEARGEQKLSDLRNRIRGLEKERNDLEEEWGGKMKERVKEMEGLRRLIEEKEAEYEGSLRKVRDAEGKVGEEEERRKVLEREIKGLKDRVEEMAEDVATAQEGERAAKEEIAQIKLQLQSTNIQMEEQKTLVTNLRTANKTLREELRKVQSSVQLMERSRNPGIGYWSSANHSHNQSQSQGSGVGNGHSATSASASVSGSGSASGQGTPTATPAPASAEGSTRRSLESTRTNGTASTNPAVPTPSAGGAGAAGTGGNEEEEVNLEYLRNVILQFLEHPHMRRQLVQVLSVILHFTPQELRRLNAKVAS